MNQKIAHPFSKFRIWRLRLRERLVVPGIAVLLLCLGTSAASAGEAGGCNDNPVFTFSRALYLEQYTVAEELLPEIGRKRGTYLAHFLAEVLAFKYAYDEQDSVQVQEALDRIDALISSLESGPVRQAGKSEELLLANIKIHAARMHLGAGHILRAAQLANQGKALLDGIGGGAQGSALAQGLYQYYAGGGEQPLGWATSWLFSEADREQGIRLMELALQRSPDHAFEALRSLMSDINWNRSNTCRYLPLLAQIEQPDQGAIGHRQLLTAGYLFCGQPRQALSQVTVFVDDNSERERAFSTKQLDWFEQARLQAMADLGDVEGLLKRLDLSGPGGRYYRMTRFALARALDARRQHESAVDVYRQVIAEDIDDNYQFLAERYLEFPYRAPRPFQQPDPALKFACSAPR